MVNLTPAVMGLTSRRLVCLMLTVAAEVVLLSTVRGLPSTRVVYYLHTRPASWNEASVMCGSYGGVLLTMPDIQATSNRLQYVDHTAWDGALGSLTGGFWTGLYRNSSGSLRWQDCTDYDPAAASPVVNSPGGVLTAPSCYVSTSDLQTLSALSCDVTRPYICQRDDGQCWFQPYMDSRVQDTDADSHTTVSAPGDSEDVAHCAKLCRSQLDSNRECWAFSFGESGAQCRLHFSPRSHKYALSTLGSLSSGAAAAYFQSAQDVTAYVKICTGGWKTTLAGSTKDTSSTAKDENCTVVPSDDWDDSICYCDCDQPPIILEAETLVMTIDEKVDKLVKELQVDPQNTSSTRRKKISVEDSRPSAQGIGYVGIACLLVVFGSVLLMDANVLLIHAGKLCGKGSSSSSSSSGNDNTNQNNSNSKKNGANENEQSQA